MQCESASPIYLSGEYFFLAHLYWHKEGKLKISSFFSLLAACCPEHFTAITSRRAIASPHRRQNQKRSVKASFLCEYSPEYCPHRCMHNPYFLGAVCNMSLSNHAISIKLGLRIWMFIEEAIFFKAIELSVSE